MLTAFDLTDRSVVVTGAAGLLGQHHVWAIAEAGGIPVALDLDVDRLAELSAELTAGGLLHMAFYADVTDEANVAAAAARIERELGPVWGLVNNVAANPPMRRGDDVASLESTSLTSWQDDLALGLTAAWLCGREFGAQMAANGGGSIVNVASDLAVIAPDHRVYRHDAGSSGQVPKKPASYSATKGGLRMLSKYFATYWLPTPVRSNCLLPGSVRGSQSESLVKELEARIPLGRLARPDEYKAALLFLLSDASSYMTGADLVMDGGRSAW